MSLNTRAPTGRVAAPLILLEGGEKSGKSWAAAMLSTSEKVGRVLWLDLGEGAADEYAQIPGTRYEVLIHDGSYRSIYEQICEARDEAHRAAAAGEPPVVLVIDNMTALWELLKEWIDGRARRREKNKKLLAQDPNTEIDLTTDLWNDATGRWRAVMTKLMTFNGPVIAIARGKEVVEIGPDGKPTRNQTYRVEGQKHLPYDATVWVRMSREAGASVVGARSVHLGVRPGDKRKPLAQDWTLEWLIFDALRYEPGTVRNLQESGDAVERRADAEELREAALTRGVTVEALRALHVRAKVSDQLAADVLDGDGRPTTLGALITTRAEIQASGQQPHDKPSGDLRDAPAVARAGAGDPDQARGGVLQACEQNGWDTGIVGALFAAEHNGLGIRDCTDALVISKFRSSLFNRPQAELQPAAAAVVNGSAQ